MDSLYSAILRPCEEERSNSCDQRRFIRLQERDWLINYPGSNIFEKKSPRDTVEIDLGVKASFRGRASLSDSQFANWQALVGACLDYQAHLVGPKRRHL